MGCPDGVFVPFNIDAKINSAYVAIGCLLYTSDTTAAGDTFNGAVCVGVSEGMSLEQAVLFASKASSISAVSYTHLDVYKRQP